MHSSWLQEKLNILELYRLETELKAKGLRDIKGVKPGPKDIARIEDIDTKSNGDKAKIRKLASAMAKSIKKYEKAQRRAAAAMKVFPKRFGMEIAQIFLAKW